ncbi:MAG: SDR family NAD(P)-dependent oxidoreductase [Planctomycetota bacterium]|nr:SDR family NAD(P)-dependent oxidoreductase [Planctomycetota bacterium]
MTPKKRVVLITGASSGIGEELSRRLASRGDQIGLLARRSEQLESIASSIRDQGGNALALPADVREKDSICQALSRLLDQWGRLDTLIVGAGVIHRKPIQKQTTEELLQTVEINLLGAIATIHATLPTFLQQQEGHIVGITSLAGYRGLSWAGSYSASKAGLSNYLEALRVELQPMGISVTDLRPGFISTAMTDDSPIWTPQIMPVERAVDRMIRAIDRRPSVYSFPPPFSWFIRLSRMLPNRLYDLFARQFLV